MIDGQGIDFTPFLEFASKFFLRTCEFINALFPFVALLIGLLVGVWLALYLGSTIINHTGTK